MLMLNKNLYRGKRPNDLEWLKNHGFKYVISLQARVNETSHERQSIPGITQVEISCPKFRPPTILQADYFLSVVRRNEKTLVHCLSGVNRTGFMCAVYRMRVQGWSFKEAHDEWVRLGRSWWCYWWKNDLKLWSNER